MNRCEYCQLRNGWECGDGWGRVSNNILCENFKLDFDSLTEKQKKTIQENLIYESEGEEW